MSAPSRAPGKELVLIRLLRTPGAVVQHDRDDRQSVSHRARDLGHGKAKATVAHDRDHGPVRRGRLGAKRRRIAKTDEAEIERCDEPGSW